MMDSRQQPSRYRQPDSRKKQILSPDLTTDHRQSRKNQTPNQDWHILGLGFRTPGEVISLNKANVLPQPGERRHVSGQSAMCRYDVFSCAGRQKAAAISDNMSKKEVMVGEIEALVDTFDKKDTFEDGNNED